MSSRYANILPFLVKDIHHFLVDALELPTNFKSTEPEVGEKYGLLSPQSLTDSTNKMLKLECMFLASAAFATYWEASSWAIATAMNLDNFLPQVKRQVDGRGILGDFERTSSITVGRPRALLAGVGAQKNHSFVVDVVMPCTIKLLIVKDVICGHT
jgi:hypothetical protein